MNLAAIARASTGWLVIAAAVAVWVPPAAAQTAPTEGEAPPKIRRWIDLQHVHLSSRFRWYESSEGEVLQSTLQWQPQIRARVLADSRGRLSLHVGAFSGGSLPSGWNNTGVGIGRFAGRFSVKQLFVQVEPVKGLDIQVGSLYANRGVVTENISYDSDTYVTGERVTWRPSRGPVTQVSGMVGYLGEFREPNFFKRADRLGDWNYGQVLVGLRLHPRVMASADYIYQHGEDILREGVTIRLPASVGLRGIQIESYQRVSPDTAAGFNLAGDFRLNGRLDITLGVMSVDRHYGPYNGDRYELGTRVYSLGNYRITPELSAGYFWGEAFATDYFIPNNHRFDLVLTYNPTQALRRAGIF
ncbi:MAG: hypothetical protein AB1635_14835 [Acidobacteriota bacterium]